VDDGVRPPEALRVDLPGAGVPVEDTVGGAVPRAGEPDDPVAPGREEVRESLAHQPGSAGDGHGQGGSVPVLPVTGEVREEAPVSKREQAVQLSPDIERPHRETSRRLELDLVLEDGASSAAGQEPVCVDPRLQGPRDKFVAEPSRFVSLPA
jgi:hypothetical protein